ncbi:Putative chromatin assembly factor 1 subunit A [Septoria linicola]|uniref:Chromatin assembly factor 1 subunit A n=1 Tax=Septoria linicola TaxID=215465 RepID=A0A9Q9AL25_9PEZI|nr:putative chromatin assembly factor 1 subunit A [Septoria linicola]USW50990.1 Putative chromatin assembly factor 1 subunit A [Septoria linicola]
MDEIISSPPNIRKRSREPESPEQKLLNLKGSQFMMPTPPDTENERSSNASPRDSAQQDAQGRAASPALSTSTTLSSVIDVASTNGEPQSSNLTASSTGPAPTSASSAPPPAKRRKLTPSEKLEQAQLKEAKARERAEKKAQAEAEKIKKEAEKEDKKAQVEEDKARKAEEKRIKDEEKRAKAEEKETKKREKELEEAKKQEEKLAKERKQMRLGAFFGSKPNTPAKRNSDGEENTIRSRRKSLSLEPFEAVADQIRSSASPIKQSPGPMSTKKPKLSDYRETFLPFEAPMHSRVATIARDQQADQDQFDHELKDPLIQEKYDLGLVASYANLDSYFGELRQAARGRRGHPNIRKIVEKAQGTSREPIDLTEESSKESPDAILRKVDTKYLHFNEDVRPAYCGTYTKITSPGTTRRTMRNPFVRTRPDTDYDYDSEAEWEEPEEGEDLGSDDDDEADSNADGDEMDDFLDDEHDKAKSKRKIVTAELIPESTGLCFANERGRVLRVDGTPVVKQPSVMDGMRMGFLLPGFAGITIDPFSTSYWETPTVAPVAPSASGAIGAQSTSSTAMAPPRKPLEPRLNFNSTAESAAFALVGAAEGEKGPITSTAALTPAAKRGRKPQPKTLSKEDLDELKDAVVGSPLGKLELHKGLKARFPKLTNDAIKENLNSLFAQKGSGKDKTWVYIGDL